MRWFLRKVSAAVKLLYGALWIFLTSIKYRKYKVILCPKGIGDICYALSYIGYFSKSCKKPLVAICMGNKQIFDFFPYFNKVVIVNNLFHFYERLLSKYKKKSAFFPLNVSQFGFGLEKQKTSYLEDVKEKVYMVIGDESITYPLIRSIDLSNHFADLGKKYVLLVPYSNSLEIDISLMNEIVLEIRKRKINILCNLSNGQKEIQGTETLNCDLNTLVYFSRNAIAVIGIRSGILDFLISNMNNCLAIYNKNSNKNVDMCKYSLKGWKTMCNVYEFDSSNKTEIIKCVKTLLSDKSGGEK